MKELGSVYLAARYDRRDELKTYKAELEKRGMRVTSRWLDEKAPLDCNLTDFNDHYNRTTAETDLEDIARAECFLLFSENPLEGYKRGGRHVETGFAIGLGKHIAIIGPKENIFHHLPYVFQFDSFEDCIAELDETLEALGV